ncbi:EncA/B family entericidin [Mesorhizobium sp. VNQ89]|nr:EncA/B family entericidin [Mesorhizobium sp.]MBL8576042.1 EncA/B family entericidin [Mesorhizobium sp.]
MKLSRIATLATILVCAIAVSACANTVRGAKRDVQATANAIEN